MELLNKEYKNKMKFIDFNYSTEDSFYYIKIMTSKKKSSDDVIIDVIRVLKKEFDKALKLDDIEGLLKLS